MHPLAACQSQVTREIQSQVSTSMHSLEHFLTLSHTLPLHDSHLNTGFLSAELQANWHRIKPTKCLIKFNLTYVRNNEVEKIDQRDLLVISKKSSLISHIEFVIPNEFKDEKIKVFHFTKMIKESMQVSMVQILILQLFKIRVRVFSNWGRRIWCEQASNSMFRNLVDKIHLEGEGTVMTHVMDKLFEFSFVIE